MAGVVHVQAHHEVVLVLRREGHLRLQFVRVDSLVLEQLPDGGRGLGLGGASANDGHVAVARLPVGHGVQPPARHLRAAQVGPRARRRGRGLDRSADKVVVQAEHLHPARWRPAPDLFKPGPAHDESRAPLLGLGLRVRVRAPPREGVGQARGQDCAPAEPGNRLNSPGLPPLQVVLQGPRVGLEVPGEEDLQARGRQLQLAPAAQREGVAPRGPGRAGHALERGVRKRRGEGAPLGAPPGGGAPGPLLPGRRHQKAVDGVAPLGVRPPLHLHPRRARDGP